MRAFYFKTEHYHAYVLGTPQGWQVSIYDLEKDEWVERCGKRKDTLKEAKSIAQEKVALLVGNKARVVKWH